MKRPLLLLLLLFLAVPHGASAQESKTLHLVRGTVTNYATKKPVYSASVNLPDYGLWSVTDQNGAFTMSRVPSGKTRIVISCLGFKPIEMVVEIVKDQNNLTFQMREENLRLKTVEITARGDQSAQGTSYMIGRQAIEHLQMINPTDIMSLLPGGSTTNPNLMKESYFNLRGSVSGDNNGSGFGTGVMIDGIRISNNFDLGSGYTGPATRNIGVADIESIEVITGVPSVEYGDMTSGMVIINTKKGQTPMMATVSMLANSKSYSLSKGFDLGGKNGILNAGVEYSHAYSRPYTRHDTYFRNVYSLNYTNTLNRGGRPVNLNINLRGTHGKTESEPDPDVPSTDWSKQKDDALRGGVSADWLINSPWITSLSFNAGANYNDNYSESSKFVIQSTAQPSVNATETGYYEANVQPSQYTLNPIVDSKGLTANAALKARLNSRIGAVNNNLKAGVSWNTSGNIGKGEYYGNDIMTNGYRPRPYTDIPFMHNISAYVEDNITIPFGKTSLDITGGVRMETVRIKDMVYEKPTTFSPRFNARYTIIAHRAGNKNLVRGLAVRAGWGMTEKLPSLGTLYPAPTYKDELAYQVNYGGEANTYYTVYHTTVYNDYFNEQLEWSRSRNAEIGLNGNIGGVRFSVAYYNNKSLNPYTIISIPEVFTYRQSDGGVALPNNTTNPGFRVDSQTGYVYVRDLNDPTSEEVLVPLLVQDSMFRYNRMQGNGSPTTTQGVELSLNFGRWDALRTSFIFDAAYRYSKNYDETINPGIYNGTHSQGLEGRTYEYLGFYVGGTGRITTYNGMKSSGMTANLTTVTHIPEIRMTVSLRLESTIFARTQNLTRYLGEEWAYLLENGERVDGSVYNKEAYTGVWPVAYMDLEGVIRPFTEVEAADPRFANLIGTSNTNYRFKKGGNNAYFMANLAITKEIGDAISLSFYVNNFTNSKPYVRDLQTGIYSTRNIDTSYGATLRIKIK